MIRAFDDSKFGGIAPVVFVVIICDDRFILQILVLRGSLREIFYKFRCILASIASDMC